MSVYPSLCSPAWCWLCETRMTLISADCKSSSNSVNEMPSDARLGKSMRRGKIPMSFSTRRMWRGSESAVHVEHWDTQVSVLSFNDITTVRRTACADVPQGPTGIAQCTIKIRSGLLLSLLPQHCQDQECTETILVRLQLPARRLPQRRASRSSWAQEAVEPSRGCGTSSGNVASWTTPNSLL